MINTGHPMKKSARIAGLLYVVMSIQAPLALLYVPSHILVDGNGQATIQNILLHEFLFRLSIISQFASTIIFVFLAITLYKIFSQVNKQQAILLLVFVAVQVPIVFILETFNFTGLMIAKGELLQALQTEQKQNFVMLLLNLHAYGMAVLEIFWGLWLIPFGILVYKSGFIPRLIGFCLFIGATGWITDSVTFLLFPVYNSLVSDYIMVAGAIGEFPIMLWLLIMGVKNNTTAADNK
jgi:Domain of unknown function (DUF4386)